MEVEVKGIGETAQRECREKRKRSQAATHETPVFTVSAKKEEAAEDTQKKSPEC